MDAGRRGTQDAGGAPRRGNHDPHWVKTRQRAVTGSSFQVALEEDSAQTSAHGSEVVGWLAIDPGTGNWSGHLYEAASTANAVTHNWYRISFGQVFRQAPHFIGGLAGYDGGDAAYVRYKRTSLTAAGVDVKIEEDATGDTETNHTSEVVSYLAIEGSGILTAQRGGSVIRKTYNLAGQPIAVRVSGDPNGNNGLYYVHTDHLGSVHILTRHSDGYVEADSLARYAPFGAWRTEPTTNPALSGRDYTGHRHNNTGANDLGLIYMGARFYVPSIGRFASADTIVPEPTNPQSFNRYSYVYNNPVNYTDPTGHLTCEDMPWECDNDGNWLDDGTKPQMSAQVNEPIRINIKDSSLSDIGLKGAEIVILPPGYKPGARNKSLSQMATGAGAIIDIFEMISSGGIGVPEGLATVDVFAAYVDSYYAGETGTLQLHPSLPEMYVLGQDFVLTTGELFVPVAAKATLTLSGSATGAPVGTVAGMEAGAAVDLVTSSVSFAYDIGRVAGVIPTKFAIGFYMDDSVPTRLPIVGVPRGQPTLVFIYYQD